MSSNNQWSKHFPTNRKDPRGRVVGYLAKHEDVVLSTMAMVSKAKRSGCKDAELGQTVTQVSVGQTRDGEEVHNSVRPAYFADLPTARAHAIKVANDFCNCGRKP